MTDSLPDDTEAELTEPELAGLEPGEDVDEFVDAYVAPPTEEPLSSTNVGASAVGFYDAGPDSHALDDLALAGRPGVLDRLGPAHFRSKGFSFMGFLQTVYDHVAGEVGGSRQREVE